MSSHPQPSSSPPSPPSDRGRCPQYLWCSEASRLGTSCPSARPVWTCAKSPPEKYKYKGYGKENDKDTKSKYQVPGPSTKPKYQVQVPGQSTKSMYQVQVPRSATKFKFQVQVPSRSTRYQVKVLDTKYQVPSSSTKFRYQVPVKNAKSPPKNPHT